MLSLPWGAGELEQELCMKTEWDGSLFLFQQAMAGELKQSQRSGGAGSGWCSLSSSRHQRQLEEQQPAEGIP